MLCLQSEIHVQRCHSLSCSTVNVIVHIIWHIFSNIQDTSEWYERLPWLFYQRRESVCCAMFHPGSTPSPHSEPDWLKWETDQKVLRICLLNFLISLQLIVSVDTFSSPGSTSLSDVMFVPPYLKSSNSTMWRSWEIRLCLIEISNLYTIFPLFLNMWRFFKQISDIIFIEATTDQWNEKCWNLFKC